MLSFKQLYHQSVDILRVIRYNLSNKINQKNISLRKKQLKKKQLTSKDPPKLYKFTALEFKFGKYLSNLFDSFDCNCKINGLQPIVTLGKNNN